MQTAILNIDRIISGDWEHPYSDGSSILVDGGLISKVGEPNKGDTGGVPMYD